MGFTPSAVGASSAKTTGGSPSRCCAISREPALTPAPDHHDSRLRRAIALLADAHLGQTGIHWLPEARAAFAARAILAAAADRSLDVQYYIWHADETGFLLFHALWQA